MIWSDEDIKVLKECVQNDVDWKQIAKILNRNVMAVRSKAYDLKIVKPKYRLDPAKKHLYEISETERIKLCLNCQHDECVNCLGNLKI